MNNDTTSGDKDLDTAGDNQSHGSTGPGSQLKEAREAARFSVADIAAQLHLTTKYIEAMEADDYSRAPKQVFVRGYLRSYAKLLNLPIEEIIAKYDSLGHVDQEREIPSTVFAHKNQGVTVESFTPWIMAVFLFGAVGMLFYWWYTQRSEPQTALSPASKFIGENKGAPENNAAGVTTQGPTQLNPAQSATQSQIQQLQNNQNQQNATAGAQQGNQVAPANQTANVQPNQAAAQPNQAVAQPNQAAAQPNQAVAQPNQAVTQPNQAAAQPNQPTGQPNQPVNVTNQTINHPGGTNNPAVFPVTGNTPPPPVANPATQQAQAAAGGTNVPPNPAAAGTATAAPAQTVQPQTVTQATAQQAAQPAVKVRKKYKWRRKYKKYYTTQGQGASQRYRPSQQYQLMTPF